MIIEYKNRENVIKSEVDDVVLTHFNFVNTDYQRNSIVLETLVSNKYFWESLEIEPTTSNIFGHLYICIVKCRDLIYWSEKSSIRERR